MISAAKPIIAIAPMMDYTDRHYRYFLRLIAPHAELYSEMITAKALLHGDADYLLAFHEQEKPVILQLGGSDPAELARAAKLGERAGYTGINLNVGCPSPRVQNGAFGACLMQKPALVADCMRAMREAGTLAVTIKCRIGVDDQDSYADLVNFVNCQQAHCDTFIIHARKAWLQGLSPKENREIPPLDYERVYQLKRDFPHLTIIINGGIKTLAEIKQHMHHVDGVMLGRQAYTEPYLLAEIEHYYYPETPILSRQEIVSAMKAYMQTELAKGVRLNQITRHILGLFHGQPGANHWRRHLSCHAHLTHLTPDILDQASTRVLSKKKRTHE